MGVSDARALELTEFARECEDDRKESVARDYFRKAEKLWATNQRGTIELMELAYVLVQGDLDRRNKIMGHLNWYKMNAHKLIEEKR